MEERKNGQEEEAEGEELERLEWALLFDRCRSLEDVRRIDEEKANRLIDLWLAQDKRCAYLLPRCLPPLLFYLHLMALSFAEWWELTGDILVRARVYPSALTV
eukprot:1617042-Rhodomonas_salina.1